ncbi:hypothetical protein [Streptomyces sasae]|uniref:hypothetical protein n=1 Tax=Streptomyces sasae TaxID=1266772 RepID=UPI002930D548|nr:hypothetical protein [Streptomyces sasae]
MSAGASPAAGATEIEFTPAVADDVTIKSGVGYNRCHDLCDQWGMPAVPITNEGVRGAAHILKYRWRAVLQLAYAIARSGYLEGSALQPYLDADPAAHQESLTASGKWLQATSDLWTVLPDDVPPLQG